MEKVVAEAVTKGAVKFFGRNIDFSQPALMTFLDWAYFCYNVAGLLIVVAGICYLWISKPAGFRLMQNSFWFLIAGKFISWFENPWFFWFVIFAYAVTYVVCNPVRTEKILLKLGVKLDLNRDGKYGSQAIPNPHAADAPDYEPSTDHDEIETDKVEDNP